MANNINSTVISGDIFAIGLHDSKGQYPVLEAKLSVCVGNSLKEGPLYDEFNIRCYGKKSIDIAKLKEGTHVVISGKLKEDIRVNANDPTTTRSKTYINIENIEW